MAQLVKPAPRFTHPEWTYSNNMKFRSAEAERQAAERLENESDRLIDETDKRTKRTLDDVNKKMDQRLDDVKYWKGELDDKLEGLKNESEKLEVYITRVEKALESVTEPLHIAQHCLGTRDGRKRIDLVHDDVQKELFKEVEVEQGVQALLRKSAEQAREQLRLNRKATYRLEQDLKGKFSAEKLDEYVRSLRSNNKDIDFVDGAAQIDAKSVTPENWQDYSNENILNAEKERQNSVNMRSILDGVLQQTANDMAAQVATTNIAFRRRIDETRDVKGKLEEHLARVFKEISNMEDNIRNLEIAIVEKEQPLKLAETRLQLRKGRPNIELCRDSAEYRMIEEVTEIRRDIVQLQQRLADSRTSLKGLVRRQLDLEEEIQIKANTLFVDDIQCMGMRESISIKSF